MESKITISFDYCQKTPFIKINYKSSEDERDRMVGAFLESMGGQVCFTKFQYEEYSEGLKIAGIRPIPLSNLPQEIKTMQAWVSSLQYETFSKQVLHYVTDTSHEFRSWLERKGIYFEADDENGQTGVSGAVNLFNLGVEWGKEKSLK